MRSSIGKNILNTIIYYDVLNFPLTSFEVWRYLTRVEDGELGVENGEKKDREFSLGDIIDVLESNELKDYIEEFRGFYFLRGRKDLARQRIENEKRSIFKFKIAERVAWWLRFVPFVRMIAVTGTLAMKNPERDSDIDYFVILEKGRIWTGRLLVTLMVQMLGKRRYGKKIKNRICLNYFVTIGSLKIKKKDLFAANEYSFIYPLFGFRFYKSFGEANIGWIKKYKPNFDFSDLKPAKFCVEHSRFSRFFQKMGEDLINFTYGDKMELWLKKKQIARIKRNPLTYKKGGYIEATDENLIFLPEPQGPKVLEKFRVLTSENVFL